MSENRVVPRKNHTITISRAAHGWDWDILGPHVQSQGNSPGSIDDAERVATGYLDAMLALPKVEDPLPSPPPPRLPRQPGDLVVPPGRRTPPPGSHPSWYMHESWLPHRSRRG